MIIAGQRYGLDPTCVQDPECKDAEHQNVKTRAPREATEPNPQPQEDDSYLYYDPSLKPMPPGYEPDESTETTNEDEDPAQ